MIGPNDRVGIVTFDSTIDVVLELDRHDTARPTSYFSNRSRRMTNLSAGWLKASKCSKHHPGRTLFEESLYSPTDMQTKVSQTLTPSLEWSVATHQQGNHLGDWFRRRIRRSARRNPGESGWRQYCWCAGPDGAPQVFDAEFGGLLKSLPTSKCASHLQHKLLFAKC